MISVSDQLTTLCTMIQPNFSKRFYLLILLALSFLPFFIKGVVYLSAGSSMPMLVPYVFGIPILFATYYRKQWSWIAVRAWAMMLMLYGLVRLALAFVFQYESAGVEAQILDQLTFGFCLTSLGYAAAGFYFWRQSKKRIADFR